MAEVRFRNVTEGEAAAIRSAGERAIREERERVARRTCEKCGADVRRTFRTSGPNGSEELVLEGQPFVSYYALNPDSDSPDVYVWDGNEGSSAKRWGEYYKALYRVHVCKKEDLKDA